MFYILIFIKTIIIITIITVIIIIGIVITKVLTANPTPCTISITFTLH